MILLLMLAAAVQTINIHIPQKFHGDNKTFVYFTNQKQIDKNCGAASDPDFYTMACSFGGKVNTMYLPNPCKDKDAKINTSYSHLLCHELAHLNGWHHVDE